MEVRKRVRVSAPDPAAEATTARKRVRPVETEAPAPAPAPEPERPGYTPGDARLYPGWQTDVGTKRDPILMGARPGDLIRLAVGSDPTHPNPLTGKAGDSTIGFILRLDVGTLVSYRVTLDGHLQFHKKHTGNLNAALSSLSADNRDVALSRSKMKRAPRHY